MAKPVIHLICNAHLDPVWQWQWEEGCAEALATFQNAVELLHEHRELIFNHNEAILYRWIMEHDLPLFKEIQRLVKKGRWCISGGWYLQPDVNLPSTESLIRHITEGRRFFKKYFNAQPEVAYNFDSFGHSGGLPQILRLSGYKMYIHLRPQSSELELPADLYRWQGVDGSEILAYRISVGLYHTEYENMLQRLKEGVELALKLQRDVPIFWGIGNHGGGATRADLQIIDQFKSEEKRVRIIHSTPDKFYEAIKPIAKNAPLIKGDLQRIFTGCYTSLSRLKRTAQKSAAHLVQCESMRTASWWSYGQPYPENELAEAWRIHLFNDFHDILPGSCIEPAEKDALNQYGMVSEIVRRLNLGTAVTFNKVEKRDWYIPITVLNHQPFSKLVPIEVECMISHRPKWKGVWHLKVYDESGKLLPSQEEQPEALLPFNGWRRKLCFMAPLPAVGVAHFQAKIVKGKPEQITNKPMIKFRLDRRTGLIHHLKVEDIQNCLTGPLLKPLVIEDLADSWGTDHWKYRKIISHFKVDPSSIRVIESGTIRTIYQSIHHYHHSKIILNTLCYSEWPILEFRIQLHWQEERKRLKLSIPTVFKNDYVLCEVPGGVIQRPADGEEHVHARWLILKESDQDDSPALAVINSGQHGIDYKNGEVRISVLRSVAYCHEQGFTLEKYPARKYMDQGIHEFRLHLLAGKFHEVLNSVSAFADWCDAPPVSFTHLPIGSYGIDQTILQHRKQSHGLFHLSEPNIRLLTCKKSWNGQSLILRLQETIGRPTTCRVRLNQPDIVMNVNFKPLEIKTIQIERTGRWKEVHLVWEK